MVDVNLAEMIGSQAEAQNREWGFESRILLWCDDNNILDCNAYANIWMVINGQLWLLLKAFGE